MQVQAVLKKVANLDIKIICPLHGPILKENLEYYINLYDIWSSYKPETEGIFIACSSIHGNTMKVAEELKDLLEQSDKKVILADLAREDISKCLENAFRYSKIVLASSTYNMGVFSPMERFLHELKGKNYQNREIRNNRKWHMGTKCRKMHKRNIIRNERYKNIRTNGYNKINAK